MTLLWIPDRADFRRLLAPTKLEHEAHFPPLAHRWLDDPEAPFEIVNAHVADPSWEHGLILVWKDTVVVEGVDRALRCLAAVTSEPRLTLAPTYGLGMAQVIAEACVARLGGRIVGMTS